MTSPRQFALASSSLAPHFLAVVIFSALLTACGGGGGGSSSGSGGGSSSSGSSGGTGSSGGPAPLPDSPPVLTIAATQDVTDPTQFQVNWGSSGATGCIATGDWSGTKVLSGSETLSSVAAQPVFGLSCSGSGGTTGISASAELSGTGISLTLSVSPSIVEFGQEATLQWSARNATQCVASQDWLGSYGSSGIAQSKGLTRNSEFSMRCEGPQGSATATVNAALGETGIPVISLVANPAAVIPGSRTVIQWLALNSTSCVRSGNWGGEVEPAGKEATDPLTEETEFSLTCSGPSGDATATLRVPLDATPVSSDQIPVAFRKANPVREGGREGHRKWVVASTEPVQGTPDQVFEVELQGDIAQVAFSLVDDAIGTSLVNVTLDRSPYSTRLLSKYSGIIAVPTVPFRIKAFGTDGTGANFDVLSRSFVPKDFSLIVDGEILPLTDSQPSMLSVQLRNAGAASSFVISGTASSKALVAPASQTINIPAGSVATVMFQVSQGFGFPKLFPEPVTLTASRAGSLANTNSLVVYAMELQ